MIKCFVAVGVACQSTTFRRMVSSQHDAMHRIFRQQPDLLARLVPETGVTFPEYSSIEPLDTDLTEIRPLERRVGSFFRVRTADEEGGFLLAVELRASRTRNSTTAGRITWRTCTPSTGCHRFCWWCAGTRRRRRGLRSPSVSGAVFIRAWRCFPWSWGRSAFVRSPTRKRRRRISALTTFSVLINAKDPGILAILDAVAPVLGPNADWAEFVEAGLDEGPGRDQWRELMAGTPRTFPAWAA